MKKISAVTCIAVLLMLMAALAQAQFQPNKSVRIVVPFPPGGTTDILARELAVQLAPRWKQSVVVENKAGAGGTIGTAEIAKSAADGYHLMVTATHQVINPSLMKKLPYDARKEFTPIALVGAVPNVLVVHPSLTANSVSDFIALAKAQPGKLSFGSTGIGGSNHLAGELFKAMAGIEMTHIPYKGAAPAMTDLLGGQIPVMFDSVPTVIQHVRSGKLRALGVTSLRRSASLPEVPTIDEAGVRGFDATAWFGLYAPGAMPADITQRLSNDILAVLRSDAIRESFAKHGVEPGTLTQSQFASFYLTELDKWARVIERANVKLD